MDPAPINQTISWREGRRCRVWELHQQGRKQKDIAVILGVTLGAVSQWLKLARAEGGGAALRRRPAPGRPSRLTPDQQRQVPGLLAQGVEAFGFRGGVWILPRVAALLQKEFGVQYSSVHSGRLLRRWG